MLTIGIDFDETIFASNQLWLNEYYEETGIRVNTNEIHGWSFTPAIPAHMLPIMYACRKPEMYRGCEPYADAYIMVNKLYLYGYSLFVVTKDTPEYVSVKHALLVEFFPFLEGRMIVTGADKWSTVTMDILIDDNPASCATFHPARSWNTQIPYYRRIRDLTRIPDIIKRGHY